ncbi:MAG: nitroreductase family protein [Phycisphaerae bacterium]
MINDKIQYRSTIDVMLTHTSVRRFTDEPINHDLLESLIEAGTRASTSSNMQAYTIISITEPERKKRITQLCADQSQIQRSAVFLAFCADLHRYVLCTQIHDVSHDELALAEALVLALVDTALVMENVAVAAESVGLGVCMIGALRNNPYQVRELLGLPMHVFPVAGMCLGWPAEQNEPKPRLPLDAVWHREQYRSDADLTRSIKAYDSILAAFFETQDIHPREPRWSKILCKRLAAIRIRSDLGRFIREQGLNL